MSNRPKGVAGTPETHWYYKCRCGSMVYWPTEPTHYIDCPCGVTIGVGVMLKPRGLNPISTERCAYLGCLLPGIHPGYGNRSYCDQHR